MRTSARNALAGTITHIQTGVVDCEVILRVSDGVEIAAVITERSQRELGLAIGKEVVALIKSSFVILAREEDLGRTSARNRLAGTVVARTDTEVNSEIILDLGDGKSLAAIVTRTSAANSQPQMQALLKFRADNGLNKDNQAAVFADPARCAVLIADLEQRLAAAKAGAP